MYYTLTYPDKKERKARVAELKAQGCSEIWITREWNIIPIPHMRDSHLKNACGALNRRLKELRENIFLSKLVEKDWDEAHTRIGSWGRVSKEYIKRFGEEPTLYPESLWLIQHIDEIGSLSREEDRMWEWIMTGW